MPWRVEYSSVTNAVAIIAGGEVSNEDAQAQVTETLRLLEQHQASLVLVDYAEALSEITLPSLYGLPDLLTRRGGLWNIQIAVVMPRSRYRLESYQFFELVCRNAGYNVKLFNERKAAEEWLQDRPHKPEETAECVAKAPCS